MQDLLNNTCNGWSHGYTATVILGANTEDIVDKIKHLPDWKYKFYNFREDGCAILIDVYRWSPHDVCTFFGSVNPDIIVYGAYHWSVNMFETQTRGNTNHNYTATFINNTPYKCDDDGWDIDVMITDKNTGYQFTIGGGMCSDNEKAMYEDIISKHQN